jgi:hypothetical protein
MLVLDDDDNVIDSKPLELIHPTATTSDEDEGATIAHLREATANAQEIAPIVASFDIEPDSDADTDMDDDYSEYSDNEYGMDDIGAELTDDYKAQMEELMRKHAVAMENAGPNFDKDVVHKLETAHRDAGLVAKSSWFAEGELKKPRKSGDKGVRFAEELDISPAAASSPASNNTNSTSTAVAETSIGEPDNPVSEAVVERSAQSAAAENKASATRKTSRFKTAMNTTNNRQPVLEDGTALKHTPVQTIPQLVSEAETTLVERPKKVSRFKAAKKGS